MRGGKRVGAGRKPGSRNKRTEALQAAVEQKADEIAQRLGTKAFTGDAHALLMEIYKDTERPIELRVDAAKAAIGYEKPRLSSVEASLDGSIGTYSAAPIPVEERDSDAMARTAGAAVGSDQAGHC
jgi:hypothetical protein